MMEKRSKIKNLRLFEYRNQMITILIVSKYITANIPSLMIVEKAKNTSFEREEQIHKLVKQMKTEIKDGKTIKKIKFDGLDLSEFL